MQTCPRCRRTLSRENYSPNGTRYNGLASICRECDRVRAREYRALNGAAINAKRRTYTPEQAETRRQKAREYYRKNAEKYIRSAKQYQARNPEKAKAWNARAREKHKPRAKEWYLKKEFGITLQQYQSMHDQQLGKCRLCNQPSTTISKGKLRALAVDHDHRTGRLRGLLCTGCNVNLGRIEAILYDSERLEAVSEYLDVDIAVRARVRVAV